MPEDEYNPYFGGSVVLHRNSNDRSPAAMKIEHFTDLRTYQASNAFALELFHVTQQWPTSERYALIDQIRRASRSVGANIAEAWGKRRYEAHFVSKLTDADSENHESEHWLIVARDCRYIPPALFEQLLLAKQQIGGMIGTMLHNPGPFLLHNSRR
jgi:four helix bundle protein